MKGKYTLDELLSVQVGCSYGCMDQYEWFDRMQEHQVELFERAHSLYKMLDRVLGQERPRALIAVLAIEMLHDKVRRLDMLPADVHHKAIKTVETWVDLGLLNGADPRRKLLGEK